MFPYAFHVLTGSNATVLVTVNPLQYPELSVNKVKCFGKVNDDNKQWTVCGSLHFSCVCLREKIMSKVNLFFAEPYCSSGCNTMSVSFSCDQNTVFV
uniref:Uncharacterized protein n=1 Tax=Arion vulgaris TaxID=1028688 RepID=A0A0B7B9H4_9EUPU